MSLAPGTLFAGRYEVTRRIAEGGMGAVYEAIHVETGRRRALKVLHPHVLRDKKAREQFRREARVGGVVESESMVDVFDAGIDEATQTPFLVMELLRGEDLARRVERLGPLPGAEVVEHLRQVAFAIDKAHAAGVVHRDLKPENLFLHERELGAPQVKILDFGVAKIVADAGPGHGETQSVGTPMFMAPEQFTGSHPVGAPADRYALGHVAYMLLVGEPYFDPEAEQETAMIAFARRVVEGPKEAPSARALRRRGVHLPQAVDAWFALATCADPAGRHASAASLVEHLESALGLSFGNAPTVVARVAPRASLPDATPVGAATPADAPGPARFGNTISGTTTPHRPQPATATSRALLLGLGVAAGGLLLGGGVWLLAREGAPAADPPASTAAAPEASAASPAPPASDDGPRVEPSAPAPAPSAAGLAPPDASSPASARPSAEAPRAPAAKVPVAPPPRPPAAPPPAPPASSAPKYSRD